MALAQQQQQLRLPASSQAPQHPLPKPESGRYHLVRFIRSDGLLDVFSENFRLPAEAIYEYVIATIDVARQKLRVTLDQVVIAEHDYQLR